MIIDTHTHLDGECYLQDIDEVIQKAIDADVKEFIIPGADVKTLPRAYELSQKYQNVYFAVGVHPYDIDGYDEKILKEYIDDEKCVAVGECGLDYFRLPKEHKDEEKRRQKECFLHQISLASRYEKPLIVHVREASQDSFDILKTHAKDLKGGVLHCFNASEALLPLADEGFYFGIGGVLTFKNAKKLVEILPKIPKEKLLIETDAPYLTPHPYRGQRNEPYYTTLVAQKMGELLDMSVKEVEDLTTKNAKKLFGI